MYSEGWKSEVDENISISMLGNIKHSLCRQISIKMRINFDEPWNVMHNICAACVRIECHVELNRIENLVVWNVFVLGEKTYGLVEWKYEIYVDTKSRFDQNNHWYEQ